MQELTPPPPPPPMGAALRSRQERAGGKGVVPDMRQAVPAVWLHAVPHHAQGSVVTLLRDPPGHQHGRHQVRAHQGQARHLRLQVLRHRLHLHRPQRQLRDTGAEQQDAGRLCAEDVHVWDAPQGGHRPPHRQLLPAPRLVDEDWARQLEEGERASVW